MNIWSKGLIGLIVVSFCLFLGNHAFSIETEITEGMKMGEFAMLLIEELEAEDQLPPAATPTDAFMLLEKLGVVLPGGWDEEAEVDKDTLREMLGMSEEEAAEYTFDGLLEMLMDRLGDVLWSLGFRTIAPMSSSPSGG